MNMQKISIAYLLISIIFCMQLIAENNNEVVISGIRNNTLPIEADSVLIFGDNCIFKIENASNIVLYEWKLEVLQDESSYNPKGYDRSPYLYAMSDTETFDVHIGNLPDSPTYQYYDWKKIYGERALYHHLGTEYIAAKITLSIEDKQGNKSSKVIPVLLNLLPEAPVLNVLSFKYGYYCYEIELYFEKGERTKYIDFAGWLPSGDGFILTSMQEISNPFIQTCVENQAFSVIARNQYGGIESNIILTNDLIEKLETSVKKVQDVKFSIYPNPAKTFVIIEIADNTSNNQSVIITDMQGQKCLQTVLNNISTINISPLAKGCYLLHIEQDGKIRYMTKLMKE